MKLVTTTSDPPARAVLCGIVFLLAMSGPVQAMAGEIVTYSDVDAVDGAKLQNIAGIAPGVLFPHTSISGNQTTVNYNPNIAGVCNPDVVFGGLSTQNNDILENNTVLIQGGNIGAAIDGVVVGGNLLSNGESRNNKVTISGGTVSGTPSVDSGVVAGGYVWGDGKIHDNHVNIFGNSRIEVAVSGGTLAGNGEVYNNDVHVSGNAEITSFVMGGASSTGDSYQNSVYISEAVTIEGDVIGGHSVNGNAINNSVTISGTPTFGQDTVLYGGESGGGNGDVFTGNTLHLHSAGIMVHGLENFQHLNFYLPQDMASGGIMLVAQESDITNSVVNVGIEGGSSPLKPGDEVVLIDSSAGALTGDPVNSEATGQGMQGVTLRYTFEVLTRENRLLARLADVGANPRIKALAEGRLGGQAFLNQGADMLTGIGLDNILAVTRGKDRGFMPFAAAQGGYSRYDTGSHVNVAGASFLAGLAWRQPVNERGAHLLAGPFFEAGRGGYDSHNSFADYASVKGDGDTTYYGGGLLGRYAFTPFASGQFYLDASLRAGRVKTDFHSSDLRGASGRRATYESSSAYYGAHTGLGYAWDLTDKTSLDLSTRYLWTRQEGDRVKAAGDPVRFKTADSHRWRSGARLTHALNDYLATYTGAYYEHEFDSKTRSSTNGYKIEAPDLIGSTGIGELGLTLKSAPDSGLSLNLGAQGYVGKRKGVTGSLKVRYEF